MRQTLLALLVMMMAPTALANPRFEVKCDGGNMGNGLWQAIVEGTLEYAGGGSHVRGVMDVTIRLNGQDTVYKAVPVEGLFSDELDYRLADLAVKKYGMPIDHPIQSIQLNDVSPWANVIVMRDKTKYTTNCVNGIVDAP